ncbi:MAG: Atu4866 domain-containing protein [Sinorhizobium meliloti]|uniref:Atu4866 domain-containing protein n=1 Tax=Rhizobium meliloti TaxID=382 RepID=UPI003F17C965|nr:Atu4866 domain-containing protein [Sinorhizobium meliloti]
MPDPRTRCRYRPARHRLEGICRRGQQFEGIYAGATRPTYVGTWVAADGHVRYELLPGGRYNEAAESAKAPIEGAMKSRQLRRLWDDTGFTADGEFIDGVLYHGGMILYPGSDLHLPPQGRSSQSVPHPAKPPSFRNRCSSSFIVRARIPFRCGKRPKRWMMSR